MYGGLLVPVANTCPPLARLPPRVHGLMAWVVPSLRTPPININGRSPPRYRGDSPRLLTQAESPAAANAAAAPCQRGGDGLKRLLARPRLNRRVSPRQRAESIDLVFTYQEYQDVFMYYSLCPALTPR
jgi:hypothetical protein